MFFSKLYEMVQEIEKVSVVEEKKKIQEIIELIPYRSQSSRNQQFYRHFHL